MQEGKKDQSKKTGTGPLPKEANDENHEKEDPVW